METDLWEILWTGTLSGVVSGLIVTGILTAMSKSKAKLMKARQREAVHMLNGEFYHWMEDCERFPVQGWETGTGGKEPCIMCRMLTSMAYEEWSVFRLPWYKRLLKKATPG